jgi:hypothetical protein
MARTLQLPRTKFTVPQLAKQWGLDPSKVRGWIRRGELRAINVGSGSKRPRFLIDAVDIEAFEKAREVIPACPPPRVPRGRRLPPVKSYI